MGGLGHILSLLLAYVLQRRRQTHIECSRVSVFLPSNRPPTHPIQDVPIWEGVKPFLASLQTCSSTSLGVALAQEGGVRL